MSATPFVPSTRWVLCDAEPNDIAHLEATLGISPILARILVNRGLTDPVAAERFLNPRLSDLYDPKLLPDFGPARDAILNARDTKAKIYVHGDYDVDGVTSAAIFSRFLRAIGCDVHTHVPHRAREGFGTSTPSPPRATSAPNSSSPATAAPPLSSRSMPPAKLAWKSSSPTIMKSARSCRTPSPSSTPIARIPPTHSMNSAARASPSKSAKA